MSVEHLRVVGPSLPVMLPAPRRRASIGAARVLASLRSRLVRLWCGLRGHERFTHCEHQRVTLRCYYCGHESPGWDVSGPTPVLRLAGDPKRHALVVPPRASSVRFDATACVASGEGGDR